MATLLLKELLQTMRCQQPRSGMPVRMPKKLIGDHTILSQERECDCQTVRTQTHQTTQTTSRMSEPLFRTTTTIMKDVTSQKNITFLPKTVNETKVFLLLIKSFKATTKQRHAKTQVVLDVVWKFQKNEITFHIGNQASGDQWPSCTTI